MRTSCGVHTQASWPPYVYVAHQELLVDGLLTQAELFLLKLTASHFGTLNMRFANQNAGKGSCCHAQ